MRGDLHRAPMRQAQSAAHMILAFDRIIASKAMHNEPTRRRRIEAHRQRAITRSMPRAGTDNLISAADFTAEQIGNMAQIDHGDASMTAVAGPSAFVLAPDARFKKPK